MVPQHSVSEARSLAAVAWTPLVVLGLGLLIGGVVTLLVPQLTAVLLSTVLAVVLLALGVGRLGLARLRRDGPAGRRAADVVVGLLLVAAGVLALVNLGGSAVVVAWFIGAVLIAAGVGDLALVLTGRAGALRAPLLVLAILLVVVGLAFLFFPGVGLAALTVVFGLLLLAGGAGALVGAWFVRRAVNRAIDRAGRVGTRRTPPGGGDVIEGEVVSSD